jgi:hypothetical protein
LHRSSHRLPWPRCQRVKDRDLGGQPNAAGTGHDGPGFAAMPAMHDVADLLIACILATLIIVTLVNMSAFPPEPTEPIRSRARKPPRPGHALAAALFGAGLLFAILTLTALPLGGMESYRHFTDHLLQRFDRLRARLSAIEVVVAHLTQGADRSIRSVLGVEPPSELLGTKPIPAPSAGLASVELPDVVVVDPPLSIRLDRSTLEANGRRANRKQGVSPPSTQVPPREVSQAPDAQLPASPRRHSAVLSTAGAKLVGGKPAATYSEKEGPRENDRGRRPKPLDSVASVGRLIAAESRAETRDVRDSVDEPRGQRPEREDLIDLRQRSEGPQKPESAEQPKKSEGLESMDTIETVGRAELETIQKTERAERLEKIEKAERPDGVEKIEKVARVERPGRPQKLERLERPEKVARITKPERIERPERRGR